MSCPVCPHCRALESPSGLVADLTRKDLPVYVLNALHYGTKIKYVAELTGWTRKMLLRVPHMGPRGVEHIEGFLDRTCDARLAPDEE